MTDFKPIEYPFHTFAWCVKDEADFRNKTPLALLGESAARFGGKFGVRVVFLEGIELLSKEYLASLESLGFDIVDYGEQFKKIVARFGAINARYSRYERNCFLRWIAFTEITGGENWRGQVWHIDSDIVLYVPLQTIAEETAGKTFVLQGCPVLTSVADKKWFEIYEKELAGLEKNIAGYSETAAKEKAEAKKNDARLWNDSVYRNPIGSDQDLLEYLVGTGKLPQTESAELKNSSLCFIENPLSIRIWHSARAGEKNAFSQSNGAIFYKNKKIPFIHYQGTFCFFANIYLILVRWKVNRLKIWEKLILFKSAETKFRISFAAKVVWKMAKWLDMRFTKEKVVRLLNQDDPGGTMPLVDVLNFIHQTKDLK